jgi:hypothetical protein
MAVRGHLWATIIAAERAVQRLTDATVEARSWIDNGDASDYTTAAMLQMSVRRAESWLAPLEDILSDLACNEVDCGYTHPEPRIGIPR